MDNIGDKQTLIRSVKPNHGYCGSRKDSETSLNSTIVRGKYLQLTELESLVQKYRYCSDSTSFFVVKFLEKILGWVYVYSDFFESDLELR